MSRDSNPSDHFILGLPRTEFYLFAIFVLFTSYALLTALYSLFLHPLRSIPGPLLHRASPIPYALALLTGRASFLTHALHERYGPVVRLSPNHLSFTDVRAWKDIYGHRTHPDLSLDENPKSRLFYGFLPEIAPSILDASREEHAQLRRALANGFSDKALREQEGRIKRYVDLLVLKLKGNVGKVDVAKWYNWVAFDVVGDLVLAEPFGCLEKGEYHPFVQLIVGTVQGGSILVAMNYLGMGWLMRVAWVMGISRLVKKFREGLKEKLQFRMDTKVAVEDLFEGLMRHREEWGVDEGRLLSNASVLVAAGSETTATLLSGATYLILSHPAALERLKKEVRSSFKSADEITIASASHLTYMVACLSEALRLYPPVTGSMVREAANGGAVIAGQLVPGGTLIECQSWAMNHSSAHWKDPWVFRPERFLHRGTEERDIIEALQPFSIGPRNCIGKNLAYAEMRLVLAKIIYSFDLSLDDESRGWIEGQKAYPLWARGPLHVHMSPVEP